MFFKEIEDHIFFKETKKFHNIVIFKYEVDIMIKNGSFKIIIEIDGKHHYKNKGHILKDKRKNKELIKKGFTVIHISNYNVKHHRKQIIKKIITKIRKHKLGKKVYKYY